MASILVLEDDEKVASFYQEWFASLGHEVTVNYTFEDACYTAMTQEHEWLVVDLVLPGSASGWTFAERYNQKYPKANVLVISAFEDKLQEVKGKMSTSSVRLKGIYCKPIPDEGIDHIEQLLSGNSTTPIIDTTIPTDIRLIVDDLARRMDRVENHTERNESSIHRNTEITTEIHNTMLRFIDQTPKTVDRILKRITWGLGIAVPVLGAIAVIGNLLIVKGCINWPE